VGRGHLSAHGQPHGGPWRQLSGRQGAGSVLDIVETPLDGTRVSAELLVGAVGALADGWGSRAVARVVEGDANPVRRWVVEAAAPRQAFSPYVLHDVRVTHGPRDELEARRRAIKDRAISEAEASKRRARSPPWVGRAIEPAPTLLLVSDVGSRPRARAPGFVPQGARVVASGWVPLVLTDGLQASTTALLAHGGQWGQPARRQAPRRRSSRSSRRGAGRSTPPSWSA
jgi:hypothetical protein